MQIIIKKKHVIAGLFSLLSIYALGGMLKVTGNLHTLSNSILGLFVFGVLFYLFVRANELEISSRLLLIVLLCGTVFSFWMVNGTNLLLFNTTNLNQVDSWFKIIAGVPFFSVLLVYLFHGIPQVNNLRLSESVEERLKTFFSFKRSFIVLWGLVFLAWIPGLIASYPGIYGYDSVYQLGYYVSGHIYLHQPLVDTYLIGFCVMNLGKLFGSRELGLLVYSVFQMLILSYSFAAILNYMTKKRVSVLLRLLFLVLFMFLPINTLMSFSATKDVIYAATFVLIVIKLLDLADQPKKLFNRWFVLSFILVVFINMIFRSQGIYVFIFSAIFGLFYFRNYWKRMLIIIVLPLIMYVVYSGPVTAALNGVKFDSIREMMSVPVVQLSRSLVDDHGELSQSEKKQIKDYIPDYQAIKINAGISDTMKNTFNAPLFEKKPMDFVDLWAHIGFKKPLTYINAFGRLTIGLWYPDMNYRDPQAYHPYWEYSSWKQNAQGTFILVKRQTPHFMKWLSDFYYQLSYENSYQKVPVVSMLFSSGFYSWTVICYIAWCLYKKRYRYLYAASSVLGLWLTLILGPVVLYRYVFPIALTLPVFFAEAITAGNKDDNTGTTTK